jgi:hypothetical protein
MLLAEAVASLPRTAFYGLAAFVLLVVFPRRQSAHAGR